MFVLQRYIAHFSIFAFTKSSYVLLIFDHRLRTRNEASGIRACTVLGVGGVVMSVSVSLNA